MSKVKVTLMLSAVLMLVVGPAMADDLFPPDWRGEPNSQTAEWDTWLTCGEPDDWISNPPEIGMPSGEWGNRHDEFAGRFGVLDIGADDEVKFDLDNYNNNNPEKLIRIQITFNAIEGGRPIAVDICVNNEPDDMYVPLAPVETHDHGMGWVTEAYDIVLMPNPESETIGLKFASYPAFVDQVVIDTICIPEPATMGLLVLGGIGVLMRRRRK